jgi:predicted ATP-grasp superfamily ATP-dependent carboligase
MRSPLLARLPNNAGSLLIAAISGRALAAAARRAGYRPLVADFFCDTDTLDIAERAIRMPGGLHSGIDAERTVETLRSLARDEAPLALVLGSGFERKTEIVDEIARHFPLAGNSGAAIRRVKDPLRLAADCAELGIPHPDVRLETPSDAENWLVKTAGGAGGWHVRRADGHAVCPGAEAPDRYFQRFAPGNSVSALFIADGHIARIVGFSRQWTSPAPEAPFRYGGAVRLRRFSRCEATKIVGWLSGLVRRAGLAGLCGADFIQGDEGHQLVEINPRPGATLDIFDSIGTPLMEAHLRAARGEAYELPRFADSMASIVTYASAGVAHFPATAWPDWTADRQAPGTRLVAGDPVCTVLASGPSAAASRRTVIRQARELERRWAGGRP